MVIMTYERENKVGLEVKLREIWKLGYVGYRRIVRYVKGFFFFLNLNV